MARPKGSKDSYRRKTHAPWNKGKKTPLEIRLKQSESARRRGALPREHYEKLSVMFRGEGGPKWRGGVTRINKLVRTKFKYRQWRSDVFTRDDFTCVLCGKRGVELHADHFPKMFAEIMDEYKVKTLDDAYQCEELWNINNGRTLCVNCHKKTETYAGKGFKKLRT